MWQAIQYVSSGLTLVAFIAAVVAFIYGKKISSTERLIRTANQDERGKLITDALEVFRIDASMLSKEQQYEIAKEQIKNRLIRSKIFAFIIIVIAILSAMVLIFTINKNENPVSANNDSQEKSESIILYAAKGPYHLGDEKLAGWPPNPRPCFEAEFYLTKKPFKTFKMKIETYGAEVNNPILLNNEKIAVLPPQGANRYGSIRPNEWSGGRSITMPADKLVIGKNKVSICAGLVTNPEFEGDKDDFQFRDLQFIAE